MSDETLQLLKAFIDAAGYDVEELPLTLMNGTPAPEFFTEYKVTKKKRKPRSQTKSEGYDSMFERLWSAYPKGHGGSKKEAYKQWMARKNEAKDIGKDPIAEKHIMAIGVKNYAAYIDATGQHVKHPATFLGHNKHYLNDYTIPDNVIKQNREKQEWEIVPEKDHLLMDWAKKNGFKVDGMDKVFDTRRKLAAQIKERRDNE